MWKSLLHSFILVFSFSNLALSMSSELGDVSSSNPLYTGLQVDIKTDGIVYYYEDAIDIRVSVINSGKDSIPLSLFPDQDMFSYYIEVFSKDGVSIPERDSYFADRFNQLEAMKKQVEAQTTIQGLSNIDFTQNKILGKQMNLRDVFDLKPGNYLIRVKFFPTTVIKDPLTYIYSPFISIIVKPKKMEIEQDLQNQKKWEIDKHNLWTPEDTVNAFFDSKKTKNWNKFFDVLDLRQLITIFSGFNDSYEYATSEDKDSILESFKNYLQDVNKNEQIMSVEIEESVIRKDQAIVRAAVETRLEERTLTREYVFKLEKQNHWVITAYTINIR